MSKQREITYKCEFCGKPFDTVVYDSVNVDLDPELREKILNGSLFMHECPHCHKKNAILVPMIYHDMKNRFMIFSGDYEYVYSGYESTENKYIPKDVADSYRYVGATNYDELTNKIIALENSLDHRIVELVNCFTGIKLNEKISKERGMEVDAVRLNYDDKGALIVVLDLRSEKESGYTTLPFNYELYRNVYDDYAKFLPESFGLIFGSKEAYRLLSADNKNLSDLDEKNVRVAIVQDNYARQIMAVVPQFCKEKYKKGDTVIVEENAKTHRDVIVRILDVNEFEIPENTEDAPVVSWKVDDGIVSTCDSDDEIENDELLRALKEYKNSGYLNKNFPAESILTGDVILELKTVLKKPIDTENAVGMTLKPDDVSVSFGVTKMNGGNYLCVYTSQDKLKGKCGRIIYSFDDVAILALNCPYEYDGIIVNSGKENVVLDYKVLLGYKYERYMTNPVRMTKLLEKLTPEEIGYMNEECYKIICKVYYEHKNVDAISKETKIPKEEVDRMLDYGYEKLIQIVKSDY